MTTINNAMSTVNVNGFIAGESLDDDLLPIAPDAKGSVNTPIPAAAASATAFIKANPNPPAPLSDKQAAALEAIKINKTIVALATLYRATMINIWAKTGDDDLLTFGSDDFTSKPTDTQVFLRGADRAAPANMTVDLPYGAGKLDLSEGDVFRTVYISKLATVLDNNKKVVSKSNVAKFPPDEKIRQWATANGFMIDDHADFDSDPSLACVAITIPLGYTKADLLTYKAARSAGDKSAIHPMHKVAASKGIVINADVEQNLMRALFAEFVEKANEPRKALVANGEWIDNFARADLHGGPLLLAKSKTKGLPADPGHFDASSGMWDLTLRDVFDLLELDKVDEPAPIPAAAASEVPEPADLLE